MLVVEQPGALTTVQDLGRTGWRHLGVALAGALDPDAAALANRLVGNRPGCAVLEYTLTGPTLRFDAAATIALCGGRTEAMHTDETGRQVRVGNGRPVVLPRGTLRVGPLRQGVRGWMAIAGGIHEPTLLGSRSTDLRGGFGGHGGRALARGDGLAVGSPSTTVPTAVSQPAWWVEFDPLPEAPMLLRFVPSDIDVRVLADFVERPWRVDARSNRQGLRLQGEALDVPVGDIVSMPVAPGTLQLPPDGQPIVLLADAQTTGGYRRLGHVAAADLPLLAQAAPGMPIHWEPVDAATSRALWRERRAQWRRLAFLLDERLPALPPAG